MALLITVGPKGTYCFYIHVKQYWFSVCCIGISLCTYICGSNWQNVLVSWISFILNIDDKRFVKFGNSYALYILKVCLHVTSPCPCLSRFIIVSMTNIWTASGWVLDQFFPSKVLWPLKQWFKLLFYDRDGDGDVACKQTFIHH